MSRPKRDPFAIPEHQCQNERLYFDYQSENWKCPVCQEVYVPTHLSPEIARGIVPTTDGWKPWLIPVKRIKFSHWLYWNPEELMETWD